MWLVTVFVAFKAPLSTHDTILAHQPGSLALHFINCFISKSFTYRVKEGLRYRIAHVGS
jgi:hypothetical protein